MRGINSWTPLYLGVKLEAISHIGVVHRSWSLF